MDFGRSDDPRVQAQLDRLSKLSVPQGRLGLETISTLLDRLGRPHTHLPCVFHVAGTNGKGSVCAFLRSILEASGKRVHMTTSPHLVRYNERIRLAGMLISDDALAQLLEEVLDAGEDLAPSFFEVTIASAFLAFSRVPADACVVEVGLGGRFDATNVLGPDVLAACGIAALGLDHERFLLAPEEGVPKDPMARIAFEKAGIAKPGVPLVTMGDAYPVAAQREIQKSAKKAGAKLIEFGTDWYAHDQGYYEDSTNELFLPEPNLHGAHQSINAAVAIAMLMHQDRLKIDISAIKAGLRQAKWPARLQRLAEGPLTVLAPDSPIWLDGGHNPSAGRAIADFFDDPVHLVIGMLEAKHPGALIEPLGDKIRSLTVVPVPGHDHHKAHAFGPQATSAASVEEALLDLPSDGFPILIAGSLYLAGEVLRLNDEIPE